MDRIIFSKYSNDRADEFKIRTDICEAEQGKRFVRKHPLKEASKKHVRNLYQIYTLLTEKYRDTDLRINQCCLKEEDAVFEYINGITLEEYLDKLLLQDTSKKRFYDTLDRYIAAVKKDSAGTKFEQSEGFRQVFGNVCVPEYLEAAELSNIDMLFENIIAADQFTVIDYEWTFSFMVPVNYILYRAFAAYACGLYDGTARTVSLEELCGYCSITDEEISLYTEMNCNFADYVMSGRKTMKEIHGLIGQKIYDPQELIKKSEEDCTLRGIQIFPDFGAGYSEADSFFLEHSEKSQNSFEVTIQCDRKYKAVRIDPAITECICRVTSVLCDGEPHNYSANGTSFQDHIIVFDTADPQIYVQNLEQVTCLKITGELCIVPKVIAASCEHTVRTLEERINALNQDIVTINGYAEQNKQKSDQVIQEYLQIIEDRGIKISELENGIQERDSKIGSLNGEVSRLTDENQEFGKRIEELTRTIENMKQTKAWKMYEKYRSLTGKNNQAE